MDKILLVFTGGTIGSATSNGTIDTTAEASFKLLELYRREDSSADSVQFDTIQPIQILSENLVPAVWPVIIQAIESRLTPEHAGVIVTHGTDTLAYTANALSLYFHRLNKPLLLVSSNYPLDNPEGNGLANFICAVDFIRQRVENGIFVSYRNPGQAMHMHRGARLTCSPQLTGDFHGVQNRFAYLYENRRFIPGETSAQGSNSNHSPKEVDEGHLFPLVPTFSDRILMVKPYPGLDYGHFNLDHVEAVLHDLYHSGTACATAQWGVKHSLTAFLARCRERSIPVYLAPVHKTENAYQSTRELIAQDAEVIWDTSIESAYVKLMLAYGNFDKLDKIRRFLATDLHYEHV